MKKFYYNYLSIFCSIFLISQKVSAQGNHVFSGAELSNFGTVDLATPGGQTWSTDRSATPGYFSAIGVANYSNPNDANANINGYVKHYANATNQSFSFPVGTGSDYRNITISGTRSATSVIATAWILGDPTSVSDPTSPNSGTHSVTSLGSGITAVSTIGQWDWQDISSDAAGLTVTVSIPDLSSFGAASNLRLVGWNGTQWISLGTSGASANTENGTLSGTMVSGITAIGIGLDLLPIATPDNVTYNPGGSTIINVLANDTTGDPIVPSSVEVAGADPSTNGKTKTVPGEGVWSVNPTTGAITFTPESGFTGSPTPITYTGKDAQGNVTSPGTITLTADALPIATPDNVTYTPGGPTTINVLANDTTGDPIVPTSVEIAGSDAGSNGKTKTVAGEGVWSVNPTTGAITFTPESGFTGSPTPITYTGKDAQGNVTAPGTITLTANLPIDYTPTIRINSPTFASAGFSRDFVVNVFEILGGSNATPVSLSIPKLSSFNITYSAFSGTSQVSSTGIANNNSDWDITENATFITCTLKPGKVIPSNGRSVIGFNAARKANIAKGTTQNITVTLLDGTGGDSNTLNNTRITSVTAN